MATVSALMSRMRVLFLKNKNNKLQTVDKTKGFRQFDESFRPPFSKGGAVKGAEPLSPSAEGEILSKRRFLLITFLLRLRCQKKSG